MNIACIHCGEKFSVAPDQLGTRGKCPHCRGTIRIPRADSAEILNRELSPPSRWLENWVSGFVAIFLHILLIAVFAMIPSTDWSRGQPGEGEAVIIGYLPRNQLVERSNDMLAAEDMRLNNQENSFDATVENILSVQSTPRTDALLNEEMISSSMGSSESFDAKSFRNLQNPTAGNEDFAQLMARLKRDGLDLVIVFDSTGSMDGEILQVKRRIERIGNVLQQLVPKTRISVCTYRDKGEKYIVRGLKLTDNLTSVIEFLGDIQAGGGRDVPEAVDAGLNWSIRQNEQLFRRESQKVIVLFGDAPPHPGQKNNCLQMASIFKRQFGGVVNTVTCHKSRRLPEFIEIARLGGGEAFLNRHERELVNQIVVLVFGSQHREKVLQAFDLLRGN